MRYSKEQLEALTVSLSHAVGMSEGDAHLFADALVDADVHGVSTHGLTRLSIYLRRIQLGLIDPKAELKVERQRAGTLALDAGNGVGHVQAIKALEMLLPMAKQNGIASATIRNSQHFGAVSYYCKSRCEG